MDEFKTCNLAQVPADAVVSRKDEDLAKRIFEVLDKLKVCDGINDVNTLFYIIYMYICCRNLPIHTLIVH